MSKHSKPSIAQPDITSKPQLDITSRLQQLELNLGLLPPQKPQIVSIPGVPPKQRNRYRVVLGNEILGDRLSINEALKLAKGGEADG